MAASARDLDLRQHHGVETPEHVEVHFELAGVGSRMAAGLMDLLFLFLGVMVLWVGGGVIVGGVLSRQGMLQGWFAAVMVLLMFSGVWGYFTLFEALNGGRHDRRARSSHRLGPWGRDRERIAGGPHRDRPA